MNLVRKTLRGPPEVEFDDATFFVKNVDSIVVYLALMWRIYFIW